MMENQMEKNMEHFNGNWDLGVVYRVHIGVVWG